MAFGERGSETGPPAASSSDQIALHLPILDGRGTLATSAVLDVPAGFDAGGQFDATLTLRGTSAVRAAFLDGRATLAGDLNTNGRLRLTLAVPGGVERLDGDVAIDGPLALSVALPGGAGMLELPITSDATAGLRTAEPGGVRLDARGTAGAPLALQLPLAGGRGELELNTTLSVDASLGLALPAGHGQLQAHARGVGPFALRLALPGGRGQISVSGAIDTPLTLSLVVPDSRAKLGVQDTVAAEATLQLRLAHGGSIDAAGPIHGRLAGVLFLPSGHGQLQLNAPIHTIVHLNRIALPHVRSTLSAAVRVDAAAEVTIDLPDGGTQLRSHFEVGLPVAPLVRLVRDEIERQVQVEHIEPASPRLMGAHDVALPLYIEVRRGVRASLRVTAHVRIDPRSKQIELRAVHAQGLNAAGRAAAWLYLNPKLLRSLRHTRLFDPIGALPAGARIEALGFKAGGRDALLVEGSLTYRAPPAATT